MLKYGFYTSLRYLLVCLSLLCSTALFAEDTLSDSDKEAKIRKTFDAYSFPELKDRLHEQEKELGALMLLRSMRISAPPDEKNTENTSGYRVASPETKFNQINKSDNFTPLAPDVVIHQVIQYLNSLTFSQSIYEKSSSFSTDYQKYQLLNSLPYYDKYGYPDPEINITRVNFYDGSSIPLTKSSPEDKTTIENTKRATSLSLTISYTVPKIAKQLHFTDKDKSVQEQIELAKITGQEVELEMTKFAYNNILYVEGLNSHGQALRQLGSSAYTGDFRFVEQMYSITEQAIEQVDSNKIKDKEALIQFFIKNYPSQPQPDKTQSEKYIAHYQFEGDVAAINVFMQPESKVETYSFDIKSNDSHYFNGLSIAQQENDGHYGLMSEQGEWIIPPTYKRLEHVAGDYYRAAGTNADINNMSVYQLILDKKQLKIQPFLLQFGVGKIYKENYLAIIDKARKNQDESNTGLLNLATHEIILPSKFGTVDVVDGFYYGYQYNKEKHNRSYEIYNLKNNKLILKGEFDDVYFDGENFTTRYTTRTTEPLKGSPDNYSLVNNKYYEYQHYDLYDIDGKKLNNTPYYKLNSNANFGKAGLLLVTDADNKQYFIDRAGKHAGPNVSQYKHIKPFSNGLAIVQGDNDKYGYIDIAGKLVIPTIYTSPEYFQGGSAKVETNDNVLLITPENKIIHTFSERLKSYSTKQDADHATYTQYNDISYDEKGQEVTKEK
ncbi:WG repeat-containing protein [Limnobaculum parvum]|uniref:WG repeat-containing protein n=1 Tax=Limnobaculum parvum TaxID=2172103 RepID=A0A2Y9TV77_9GAMM|nr:WG repeat-containing protein [Limnobaculum parvum]AWH87593.1 WG repeat-containing protein [Limnobaculum parvum]